MNYIRCRGRLFSFAMLLALLGFGTQVIGMEPIGLAVSNGTFRVDGYAVQESSTLFDGATVESGNLPAALRFASGTQLRLGPHSRVHIRGTRLVVDRGVGQIINPQKYEIQSLAFRLAALATGSVGRVELPADNTVTASAINGSFQVLTIGGSLVATLDAGTALNFVPQAASAQAATRIIGCVRRQNNTFVVRDEITKSEFELLIAPGTPGVDLNREVGRRVELTGEASAASGTPRTPRLLFTATALTRLGSCGNPLLAWFGAQAVPILAGVAVGSVVRGLFCELAPPVSP